MCISIDEGVKTMLKKSESMLVAASASQNGCKFKPSTVVWFTTGLTRS